MENEKQFIKRDLPTGTGLESEPKETLPAVEVDNEVVWVNPVFKEAPFDFEEGKPSKLGIFLNRKSGIFLNPDIHTADNLINLKMIKGHHRSGFLGRVIFKDDGNNLYRDIDLKGIGHIKDSNLEFNVGDVGRKENKTAYGIFDLNYAQYAKDRSEEFINAGIRTERYLALILLKEIIDLKGDKISTKEAKERKKLWRRQEPVIAIRALGTKFRIGDISKGGSDKKILAEKSARIADAKKIVAQELGIENEEFSLENYLKWFAETAGKNLGLMHKNKWSHNYLTEHNITLDCRIIDLDSVDDLPGWRGKREEVMEEDCKNLLNSITALSYYLPVDHDELPFRNKIFLDKTMVYEEKLYKPFLEEYVKNLGYVPKFLKDVINTN